MMKGKLMKRLVVILVVFACGCITTPAQRQQREAHRFLREQIKAGNCLTFYTYVDQAGNPIIPMTKDGPADPIAAIRWAKCPSKCPQWDSTCSAPERAAAAKKK